MKRYIICELEESDIGIAKNDQVEINNYRLRKAARGILIKGGKVALLNVTTKKYHKLPGGGIEKGEEIENAFKREVKEETGWDCEITDEGPVTIEYRNKLKILQISYVFIARAVGNPSEQQLENDEITEGHDLEWVPIEKVEKILSEENPPGYEDRFITLRDQSIVSFYKDKLKKL